MNANLKMLYFVVILLSGSQDGKSHIFYIIKTQDDHAIVFKILSEWNFYFNSVEVVGGNMINPLIEY